MEDQGIGIFGGMLVVIGVLSLWKVIRFWFRDGRSKKFDPKYWAANNWGDYIIHMGITAIFFFFEHDVLNTLNPLLEKWGVSWQIPHPENKGFLFVLVPIVISIVLYPLLRKYLSKPTQQKLAPHIHDEFCDH